MKPIPNATGSSRQAGIPLSQPTETCQELVPISAFLGQILLRKASATGLCQSAKKHSSSQRNNDTACTHLVLPYLQLPLLSLAVKPMTLGVFVLEKKQTQTPPPPPIWRQPPFSTPGMAKTMPLLFMHCLSAAALVSQRSLKASSWWLSSLTLIPPKLVLVSISIGSTASIALRLSVWVRHGVPFLGLASRQNRICRGAPAAAKAAGTEAAALRPHSQAHLASGWAPPIQYKPDLGLSQNRELPIQKEYPQERANTHTHTLEALKWVKSPFVSYCSPKTQTRGQLKYKKGILQRAYFFRLWKPCLGMPINSKCPGLFSIVCFNQLH